MSRTTESKRSARTESPTVADMSENPPLEAGLYIVATPIGNASDITLRALDILNRADALVAEDTRQLRKLMDIHGVKLGDRPLMSYNDRNGASRRPHIMGLLEAGKSLAYTCDAGTPMIADPGYRLVVDAQSADIPVHAAPGASAVLTALTLSGLPTDRFLFAGFLPPKSGQRRKILQEVQDLRASLVFYESPRRLAGALTDMRSTLGPERPAVIARELTKKFQEISRGTLAELAQRFAEEPTPKGEVVVLLGPPADDATQINAREHLDSALTRALEQYSVKEAARRVADDLGLPKREVYAEALRLAGK